MPVTTFDIPDHLLSFIDSLVGSGKARNRREIVVQALEIYSKFQAHLWNGPLITVDGARKGLISKGTMAELFSVMSETELHEAGIRMGKTLKDWLIRHRLQPTRVEDKKTALEMLEDHGWGKFSIDQDRIVILDPLLPEPIMFGYLEEGLSTNLIEISTSDDIAVFQLREGPPPVRGYVATKLDEPSLPSY